jgi:hypothetical protein
MTVVGVLTTKLSRRRRSHVTRTVAVIIGMAGLSLMLTACGGPTNDAVAQLGSTTTQASPSSNASSTSGQVAKALAYTHCMRGHGVLKFPDPNSQGQIPKVGLQQLGVSSAQYQAAQSTCSHLLPSNGGSSQSSDQLMMNSLWKFARCVRAHGVPNWPDPLAESDPGQPGTPGFPRTLTGIDTNSPHVKDAMSACQHLIPGYASGGYP